MSSIFGERLRMLRKERGVSISLLAQSTGLSRRTIYYWEAGAKKPKSLESIHVLSEFFGVAPEAFFRDTAMDLPGEVRRLREEVAELRRHIEGDSAG